MQFADAFHFPMSQRDTLNAVFPKLHVVLFSRNPHIELCADIDLLCEIIVHHDFENLPAISRF